MSVPLFNVFIASVQFLCKDEISLVRITIAGKSKKGQQSSIYLRTRTHYTVVGFEDCPPLSQPHGPTHLPRVVLRHVNHLQRSNRMLKPFSCDDVI